MTTPRGLLVFVVMSFFLLHTINWGIGRIWRSPLDLSKTSPPLYPSDIEFRIQTGELMPPLQISTDSRGRILGESDKHSPHKVVGASLVSNELTPASYRWTELTQPSLENWGFPYNTIGESRAVIEFLMAQNPGSIQTVYLSDVNHTLDRFLKRGTLTPQRRDFPFLGRAEEQRIFGELIFSEPIYSFLFWLKIKWQGIEVLDYPLQAASGVPHNFFKKILASIKEDLLPKRWEELKRIREVTPTNARLVLIQDPIPLFSVSDGSLSHTFNRPYSHVQLNSLLDLLWEQNRLFSKSFSALLFPVQDCFKKQKENSLFQRGFYLTREGNKVMATCLQSFNTKETTDE
jgi:hypothetical protein